MNMVRIDDRTDEQRTTHVVLVKARDNFMSGWGQCRNGYSVAAWACRPQDAQAVHAWVSARDEMRYVAVVGDNYRPPRTTEHYHIYVVGDNHRALEGAAA